MKIENHILNFSEFIPHWFEDVQFVIIKKWEKENTIANKV